MDRETLQAEAVIAPETTRAGLRRYSAGSMLMLQLLGHPLADLTPEGVQAIEHDPLKLAIFGWLHSEPLDEVRQAVMAYKYAPDNLIELVVAWAEQYTPIQLWQLSRDILEDAYMVAAALAAVNDSASNGKN